MIAAVPKEIELDEHRVSMLPVGVEELVRHGHQVLFQVGAGLGSGLVDQEYLQQGAELVASAEDIFFRTDFVIKVQKLQSDEWSLVGPGQLLFTYFHFAADRELTEAMIQTKATCIAYEALADENGQLPLLTPMSEVAGRMSIQEGAAYLERPQMRRGILLAGVPGVAPAHIAILGGGVVGVYAAKIAVGFQADVTILDTNMNRLRYLDDFMPANVKVLSSDCHTVRDQLILADLVIGAVLTPGAKTPCLIEREDLSLLKPGRMTSDVVIDQGGCMETTRPTTHSDPTCIVDGVVHYCVANMPGAVGRTSTFAFCDVTLLWSLQLADGGIDVMETSAPLVRAVNM